MKFEKISEISLKVIVDFKELPDSNFSKDDGKSIVLAQSTFFNILERAYHECDFDTTNYKLDIDAKALKNGNCVFIITKLYNLNKSKVNEYKNDSRIIDFLCFNSLDEFFEFSKKTKDLNIDLLSFKTELYKYNNLYYLLLNNYYPTFNKHALTNSNIKKIKKFNSIAFEFYQSLPDEFLLRSSINEHGIKLFGDNAINIASKYF